MKHLIMMMALWIGFQAHAQWTYDVFDNGFATEVGELNFPVTYSHNACDFSFSVWNGLAFDDHKINNLAGCVTNDHFVVIDAHAYLMPDGFVFDFFADQWSSAAVLDLGICSAGAPILTGSPNLSLGGQSFQIDTTQRLVIDKLDGSTFFKFKSMNGDIACTNGVSYLYLTELIFAGGFE